MPAGKPDFYTKNTGILLHQGMCIIQDYYAHKENAPKAPIFIVKSLNDLIFLRKMKSGNYGVIFRNEGTHHKTPVIFHDNHIIILDSLGPTRDYGSRTEQAFRSAKIKEYEDQENHRLIPSAFIGKQIFNAGFQRQKDYYSCGSDAFLVLKEGLRMGQDLVTQLEEHYDKYDKNNIVPPQIAKYSQLDLGYSAQGKKGMLIEFPKMADAHIPVNKPGDNKTTTLRQYIDDKKGRSVLEARATKHRGIIDAHQKECEKADTKEIIRTASAVDIIESLSLSKLDAYFCSWKSRDDRDENVLALLGVKGTLSGPKGSITFFAYDTFGDVLSCRKLVDKATRRYQEVLDNYINDGSTSLKDLARQRYALCYAEEQLARIKPKCIIKVASDSQLSNSSDEDTISQSFSP